jgi:hypothetical protein
MQSKVMVAQCFGSQHTEGIAVAVLAEQFSGAALRYQNGGPSEYFGRDFDSISCWRVGR